MPSQNGISAAIKKPLRAAVVIHPLDQASPCPFLLPEEVPNTSFFFFLPVNLNSPSEFSSLLVGPARHISFIGCLALYQAAAAPVHFHFPSILSLPSNSNSFFDCLRILVSLVQQPSLVLVPVQDPSTGPVLPSFSRFPGTSGFYICSYRQHSPCDSSFYIFSISSARSFLPAAVSIYPLALVRTIDRRGRYHLYLVFGRPFVPSRRRSLFRSTPLGLCAQLGWKRSYRIRVGHLSLRSLAVWLWCFENIARKVSTTYLLFSNSPFSFTIEK